MRVLIVPATALLAGLLPLLPGCSSGGAPTLSPAAAEDGAATSDSGVGLDGSVPDSGTFGGSSGGGSGSSSGSSSGGGPGTADDGGPGDGAAAISPPPQAAGYNLVFEDDFNTLNISPNRLGNYTWYGGIWWEPGIAPLSSISDTNSTVTLDWLSGQNPPDTDIMTAAQDGSYSKAWRYGYFEARMSWYVTTGNWPAFWLIPIQGITQSDAETGEIDIFEGQGSTPHTFYGTLHDWQNGKDLQNTDGNNTFQLDSSIDLSQFHTYGLLWVPGKVTWYLDNLPLSSTNTFPIFDTQDYFIVLSGQEGNNWSAGNLSGVTASKMALNVDWVHVWQK
jgi:hypothetical protein